MLNWTLPDSLTLTAPKPSSTAPKGDSKVKYLGPPVKGLIPCLNKWIPPALTKAWPKVDSGV